MSVKMRQEVERKIATKVIDDALAAGYALNTDISDGPELASPTSDRKTIIDSMFLGDKDRLLFYKKDGKDPIGWVYFIYGNDGWDVISDYTVNLEEILKGANVIVDSYAD